QVWAQTAPAHSSMTVIARTSPGSGTTSTTSPLPSSGIAPVNLDLTSTARNLTPGNLVNTVPVMINVGAASHSVAKTDLLTPAELLAVYQVSRLGQQTIQLGALGNAVGGSFTMGPRFSQYVSNLVVPTGVTAIRDFGTSGSLNIAGNLVNSGAFYGVS